MTRLHLFPRISLYPVTAILTLVSVLLLAAVLLSPAGCGGCTSSGPARMVQLLDTTETVSAGTSMEFTASRREDANLVFADLTWSGDATLGLESEALGCRCGSVCNPLWSTGEDGPNERHLEGDISCTRDGYSLTVVGDAAQDTEFRLVVRYETSVCER